MPQHNDTFYALLALDYSNAAQLSGYPGCVLVEGKDDVDFWKKMFALHGFSPEFIYCTLNENAGVTTGVSHCLKFKEWATPDFLVCIDSDYRYPTQDASLAGQPCLLQTYTHSIENHYAHFDRLNAVCKEACTWENELFDFKTFQETYSENLYPLFLWHIEHLLEPLPGYTSDDFLRCMNESHEGISKKEVASYAAKIIDKLKKEVDRQTKIYASAYPDRHPETRTARLAALGITPQHTLLFVRGHNLRILMEAVVDAVTDEMLKREKEKMGNDPDRIRALVVKRKRCRELFAGPPLSLTYPEIRRLSEDIRQIVALREENGE